MGCEGRITCFKLLLALVPTFFFLFDVPALIKGHHLYYEVGSYELGTYCISYQWGVDKEKD